MAYYMLQYDYIEVGQGLHKPNICSKCKIIFSLSCDSYKTLASYNHPSLLFDCNIGEESELELGFGKGELSGILHSCVEDMKSGDKRKYTVTITKDLDYLKENTEFQFDVELLMFTQTEHFYTLSPEKKIAIALRLKEFGNKLFISNEPFTAALFYSLAVKYIISIHSNKEYDTKNEKYKTVLVSCKLNLSACQLKRKIYVETIQNCSDVLFLQPMSSKALYRRGCAYLALNDYENAQSDIVLGLKLEPQNPALKKLMFSFNKKKQMEDIQLSERLKTMFF